MKTTSPFRLMKKRVCLLLKNYTHNTVHGDKIASVACDFVIMHFHFFL